MKDKYNIRILFIITFCMLFIPTAGHADPADIVSKYQ